MEPDPYPNVYNEPSEEAEFKGAYNGTDEFFEEFAELPGEVDDDNYSEENFVIDESALFDLEETTTYTVKKHPPWFAKHGIVPYLILKTTDFDMPNYQEVYVGKFWSKIHRDYYQSYATKADNYCFVKFVYLNE
ncbi:MAG: hypothetical protein GY786_01785 [Proteobacteria bacterium]|nr:hypothetical protein [Pseudomonadota bacterium]